MVNTLEPGEKIEIADAKRPASNFDSFTTSLAKYVGAALEIPMEVLVKNFTSSYSASRAALLSAWQAFRMRRSWLAADFCQPVYELFLAEAIAKGRIHAPGFFLDPVIRMAYCGAQWNGPAQGMVDPVKEVTAAEKRIAIGVSTRQRETTEMMGGDFENNITQLTRENQLMKKAGLLTVAGPGSGENGNLEEREGKTDAKETNADSEGDGTDADTNGDEAKDE